MSVVYRIDDGITTPVNEISARLGNLTAIHEIIGEVVVASVQQNFEDGGRPSGWADLSEVTKAQRVQVRKWPGKILVRSGELKRVYAEATREKAVVHANKVYAAVQQFGARKGQFGQYKNRPIPWGDIPARPFMLVQDADIVEIEDTLKKYVLRGL